MLAIRNIDSFLGLFGTHAYGVHLNGFVKDSQNNMSMWIGKRSDNKQTWPGKYDNMVGLIYLRRSRNLKINLDNFVRISALEY